MRRVQLWLLLFSCGCVLERSPMTDAVSSNRGISQQQSNIRYLERQVVAPDYEVADVWEEWKPTQRRFQLEVAAKDVFQILPTKLDKRYRNPCWTDPSTGEMRCLPYYQILGVSKCGTTDMYARMQMHPDVVHAIKGPHFWDECPYPSAYAYVCDAPPSGSFPDYLKLFSVAANYIHDHPHVITGEASSNTFTGVLTYLRGELSRFTSPLNVTLAHLLREVVPYSRFIVLFRNPVDRYYSAFQYYRVDGAAPGTPDEFHSLAVADMALWRACVAERDQRECVSRYQPRQLVKGMYAEFVEEWTSVFPRSQIIFIRFEDYKAALKLHLAAVFKFLGLRDLNASEWDGVLAMDAVNKRSNKYPPMRNDTRHLLDEFYKPFNKKLSKQMHDSRYLWHSRRRG